MKEINGFPGYFVTREGKVYSNKKCPRNLKGELKELSPSNHRGYKQINFTQNGKGKSVRVHRLVAEAFIPNPDNLPEVNHIDENKSNNHVDNLEWCDRIYNVSCSNAKLCIIENKNGERFEVFGLKTWCRENHMRPNLLRLTYKGKRNWHKNHRIVSIHELSTEDRRARMLDAMITSTTE